EIGDVLPCHLCKIDASGGRRGDSILAGQREKLIEQMSDPADARFKDCEPLASDGGKLELCDVFDLEADRRDRASKFVRCFGNETALPDHHSLHALEKTVDGQHE